MRKRVNIMTWADLSVVTKFVNLLHEEMIRYAPYSRIDEATGEYGRGTLFGDQNVIIAMITLRNKLNELIDRSKAANS